MRCTTTVTLVAMISVFALVNSYPVAQEKGFRSEALDRLLMIEADKEAALRNKRTIGILRQLFPDITQDVNPEAENRVNEVGSESQNNEVRVQFADEQSANEAVPNLTPLEDVESSDDENRNKRFLNFGFGGSSGGSGAGSGNFLFDIIRMVAGSGSQSNASGDASAGRGDGTQEAIPGPITRLFVIANRGISNLLQDLILRLAATSERIVNFKARLITSII
ncbi:PREDICTED: uncharacterized protein LOC107069061 isoform X1 [Polistes dominula]|uniref:Uncharacterized protein LOC107069061 isoform X1 n=1 Tax=Polistes dominula TaxID=743375 RepID=A0ABM1IMR2_POLDO|nr:PREDICTED: uncharacterized protein LOC107069061 isoform X1 [Polistes dominula]